MLGAVISIASFLIKLDPNIPSAVKGIVLPGIAGVFSCSSKERRGGERNRSAKSCRDPSQGALPLGCRGTPAEMQFAAPGPGRWERRGAGCPGQRGGAGDASPPGTRSSRGLSLGDPKEPRWVRVCCRRGMLPGRDRPGCPLRGRGGPSHLPPAPALLLLLCLPAGGSSSRLALPPPGSSTN